MIYNKQFAIVASPYWRWRKYNTYEYSPLIQTVMPARENYDTFKHVSKTT